MNLPIARLNCRERQSGLAAGKTVPLFDRIKCSRRPTDAAKQIPEALFRANRIKDQIHGEI
jgi:hypothetical protein